MMRRDDEYRFCIAIMFCCISEDTQASIFRELADGCTSSSTVLYNPQVVDTIALHQADSHNKNYDQ
jgi:hypothetical protein